MIRLALRVAWPRTWPIAKLCLEVRPGSATTLTHNGGKI